MKKVTMLFVMSLLMLCFLGACGSQTSQPAESTVSQITQTGQQNEASAENAIVMPELEGDNRKTLVVYFSASGNTRAVAEYIAEAANADTLELVPVAAYTDADLDWTVENSRVNREYEDESLRNIELVEETVQGLGGLRYGICGLSYLVGDCGLAGERFCGGQRFYRQNGDSVLHLHQL